MTGPGAADGGEGSTTRSISIRSGLLALLVLLGPGCGDQPPSRPPSPPPPSDRPPGNAFRSGFEATTALSGARLSPSDTWVESLEGTDGQTGFTWPADLPGDAARSGFYYLVAEGEDIESIVQTRIDDVPGHTGEPTRALYQAVLQEHQSTASQARNMFLLWNDATNVFARGAIRYWLKLQPDLREVLPPGSWRQVMEWRELDNLYRMGVLILPDRATGELYWEVHGDYGPRWDRDWTIRNRAIPVPLGEWMLFEAYWREGSAGEGRLLIRVNCQTLADHVGRTGDRGPIEMIHLFKVYAAPESLALGPSYQWIDDVTLDSALPETCP